MWHSIQDYLKKINSSLTVLNCVSLLFTTLFLVVSFLFLYKEKEKLNLPVLYSSNNQLEVTYASSNVPTIFASKNGKTYTFSWCQGANRILAKNRIYYKNEDDARQVGKVLSKLCQK